MVSYESKLSIVYVSFKLFRVILVIRGAKESIWTIIGDCVSPGDWRCVLGETEEEQREAV